MSRRKIDWVVLMIPIMCIAMISAFLFLFPEEANLIIGEIRFIVGDRLGIFYLALGLGMVIVSFYLACSKYGEIVLGEEGEKPKYSFFTWGSMMFTCGLAADIIFYSFIEWVMYATNPHIAEQGDVYEWAGVYPLFHWSFIPWSFYLVLAIAFGFMLHVRKRKRRRFSEACRPLIGKKADGILGKIIDIFALFALLAGTATTFSVATPLLAEIVIELFGISVTRESITIIILGITCGVYTYAAIRGFRGISLLARLCVALFFGMLILVLLAGGQTQFIVENGFQSLGRLLQDFIELSTYMDPIRKNHFPQDWTIYYWAYWMVWCIAAPFFIGEISKGRTVRQTILGGYMFGVGSTLISFIIFGNYSLGLQVSKKADFIAKYTVDGDLYELILEIIHTMPCDRFFLVILMICMIAFYATSFDSIAYTAAGYSYRELEETQRPHVWILFLWCILLILLPIAFTFAESPMENIQSISIISALPIGGIIIMMVWSLFCDIKMYRGKKP